MKKYLLFILFVLFSICGYTQINEGFEGAVFPPTGWAVFDNGVNVALPVNWKSTPTPNTGAKAAFMDRPGNIGINVISQDFLATPSTVVPVNGQLKFFARRSLLPQTVNKYQVRIKLVSAGAQNDPVGYNIVQQYTDLDLAAVVNVYEQKVINIPAIYQNVPVYIAFCFEYTQPAAASTGNRWFVDDVGVIQPCITPADTTLTVAPIVAVSATLNWTATPGTLSYDIENVLQTGAFTGVPTSNSTTSSFLQTGLTGSTCYKYKIRANCGNNNFGPWSTAEKDYCTTVAPPPCGGLFFDSGGLAGNYSDNETTTTVICPDSANPTYKVTVTFTAFNTEINFATPPQGYDGLYVYDGNTATSPLISSGNPIGLGTALATPGAYWGTTIPGPFTSTSSDGCLTFVFKSEGSGTRAGWSSNVTCAAPPTCQQPTALAVANITATTAQLSWTSPGTATSWQVLVLPASAPAPLPTATGFFTTSTASYLATLLTANTDYIYYVRGNCGAVNGVSLWSGPKAFTTLATCPAPTISATPSTVTTTTTSATIGWTEVGTATVWQIFAVACGSPAPTASATGWTSVTTNPATLPNLSSGTCYDFYVRSSCSATDLSTWSGPQTGTTQALPAVCGGNFVDNGGLGGSPTTTGAPNNYLNSSNDPITICPTIAGEVVTVNFIAFDTEATWDALYVYDGNSINPLTLISSGNPPSNVPGGLAGGFWGTISPGTVTSTSPDGCLTFVFRSDTAVDRAGWNSLITCGPRPTCAKPKTLITSAVTSTSATLAWTQPQNFDGSTASTWQVIAVLCGATAPVATNPSWITTTNNPYTFTALLPDTCYDFYVKAVCSPTDSSTLSNSTSATTQLTPPVCGDIYTDNGGAAGDYLASSNVTTTICPTIPGELVTVTFTSFDTESSFDGLYVYDGDSSLAPIIDSGNPIGFGFPTPTLDMPGAYWGTTIPGPFTSSSADGCLTFVFKSDNSFNRDGWVANVTCAPRPSCTKPKLLVFNNVTLVGATISWTQLPNPNGTASTAWQYLVLPAGSIPPTSISTGWVDTASSTNNVVVGLQSATCYDYYVRSVCSATDSSLWAGPKTFCTLIANDECANSTTVLTNPDQSCANIAAGSLIGASASAEINGCGNAQSEDVWFNFTATSTIHSIDLRDIVGNAFNLNFAVYSGTCSNLIQISCVTGTNGIANNLIIGQNYTIRVFVDSFATNSNITFNVCIGTIPPVIAANSTQYTPVQLVENVLLNSTCASVSNITFSTGTTFGRPENGLGYFSQNGSTFPFTDGIILSTGIATNATGPNSSILSNGGGGGATWGGDTDLNTVINNAGITFTSNNATVLEFDFTPITNNISFEYIFASEEYGTFQCSFSDSFAFLLTDSVTNVTTNLAVVPGTNTPISVYSVRDATYNTNCSTENVAYFGQYNLLPGVSPLASPINFNGQTKPLFATSNVVINRPYHIKLVIADNADTAFDSAVFLKGSSFGIGNLNVGNNLLQANGTALCFGATRILDTTLDALLYTFEWKKDGVVLLGQTGSTLTVTMAGTYSVHVTYIGSNCTGDDSVIVEYFDEIVTPSTAPNLASCINSYDLTQNNNILINGQAGLTVKYFLTSADATADTNPILNPANFIPSPPVYPFTICARIQNAGNCFKVSCFNLVQTVATGTNFATISPICAGSVAPILLGTSPNGISGTWLPATISNTASGNYVFTPGSSCYTGQTLNVVVVPVLSSNFAPIADFCAGTVAPILLPTSPNGVAGNWFPAIISNTISGSYTFAPSDSCNNGQVLNVVVVPVLTPNFAPIADFCAGTVAPLLLTTSPNGVSGTWSPPIISNTASGSYTFTPTGTCNNPQILNVVVSPIRTPDFAVIASFCSGTTAPILVTTSPNGVSGSWLPTIISNTISGSYTFTPANSCDNGQVLNVAIIPKTIPTFAIADICQGDSLVLPNNSNNTVPIPGIWNPASTNTNNTGVFTSTFTPDAGQCASTTTVNITIKEVPMFGITGNCQGGQYTLDVVPEIAGASYVWTNAAGTTLSSTSTTQVVNAIGDYKCKVTNSNGCFKTITLNVTNVVCKIQKGISPNGDNRNDKFDLTTLNVKQLEIFNRYGLKVYGLTNYTDQWEGQTDGGIALPDGTYYYVAELADGNTKTGWVYINKETK